MGTSARPGRRPVRPAARRNARGCQGAQASAASSLHDVVGMDAGQHRMGDHGRHRRVGEHAVETHKLRAGRGSTSISTSGLPKDMRRLSRWRSRSPASATPRSDAGSEVTLRAIPAAWRPVGPNGQQPAHDFAGTNESTSATLVRCEIEMLRGFDCVQRIPSRSQYSQKSPRMSADRFEEPPRIRVLRHPPAGQQRREPIDGPAAVRVQQPAQELPREPIHDLTLPARELDLAVMLAPRPVLGERLGPPLARAPDTDAAMEGGVDCVLLSAPAASASSPSRSLR